MTTVKVADLFCGLGGLSEGLHEACADLGVKVELVAAAMLWGARFEAIRREEDTQP